MTFSIKPKHKIRQERTLPPVKVTEIKTIQIISVCNGLIQVELHNAGSKLCIGLLLGMVLLLTTANVYATEATADNPTRTAISDAVLTGDVDSAAASLTDILTPSNGDDSEEDNPARSDNDGAGEDLPHTGGGTLTENTTVIETTPDDTNDIDIEERITGIFSEIEGLGAVTVRVNQGVVDLGGEVPNEKKAHQAVNLASRVSDVVAVDDGISRTLDVQDNVTPVISSLKQQAQGLIKAAPLLLVAFLVFGVVAWFGSWIANRKTLWERITPNPFVAELVSQTVKAIFVVIALILALSFIGAEAIISTLLGGAGVVGIAVGFAVKDTIENYIASLLLSVRQPFRARDHVLINDKEGIVVRLTSRATILMTLDGNRLRVPNAEVFKATILNYTQNPERRFDFDLGVDANDDPLAAIKVGVDAINALDFILKDPATIAVIDDVGDSNIILNFQAWIDQTETDLFKGRSIAIREAKHALENTGFSLPEPIYKVRFDGGVEKALKHLRGVISAHTVASANDTAQASHEQTPNTSTPILNGQSPNITVTPTSDNEQIIQLNSDVLSPEAADDTMSDTEDKIAAKVRSKEILGDSDPTDVLNAKPDRKLMEKVEEEIRDTSSDKDLLSQDGPQE